MKKIFIFLILLLIALTSCYSRIAKAQGIGFYEGDYLKNIWMSRKPANSNTIYYQRARFFNRDGDMAFAYCVQPLATFNRSIYYDDQPITNLSATQKERISLLVHFGYMYQNHTAEKWYAITQFLIWQVAEPTGDYWFTDSLNGNRINIFTTEMAELNNLVDNYLKKPNITTEYYLVVGESLTITDSNNSLANYTSDNSNLKIENNTITANNLAVGDYTFTLTKSSTYFNKPIIFYHSATSQNLVIYGDTEPEKITLNIHVQNPKLTINKIDADTKSTTPSGEGVLYGATYELYNDTTKVATITIPETNSAAIDHLAYGTYHLKEIKAGTGYLIDPNTYDFTISKDNTFINLTLSNQIIKKDITINKVYGEDTNLQSEPNIAFNIYDKNNNEKTIITDDHGTAQISLVYGHYTIKQSTTTPGYKLAADFNINVANTEPITYQLTDYKIKVPNTSTNIIKKVLLYILLCLKSFVYA